MAMTSGYQRHCERLAWQLSSAIPEKMGWREQEPGEAAAAVVSVVGLVLMALSLVEEEVPMVVLDWLMVVVVVVEEKVQVVGM